MLNFKAISAAVSEKSLEKLLVLTTQMQTLMPHVHDNSLFASICQKIIHGPSSNLVGKFLMLCFHTSRV